MRKQIQLLAEIVSPEGLQCDRSHGAKQMQYQDLGIPSQPPSFLNQPL